MKIEEPVPESSDEGFDISGNSIVSGESVDAVVALPVPAEAGSFTDIQGSDEQEDIGQRWPEFLDIILRDRPHLGSFLSHAAVISSSPSSIDLMFPSTCRFQYNEITRRNHRDDISHLLQEFAGRRIDLHITLEESGGDTGKKGIPAEMLFHAGSSTINEEIEKEPVIQSLLDIFDGEILQ